MDFVTITENERRHFWILITSLMAEVNSSFQHLTHGDRHLILHGRVKITQAQQHPNNLTQLFRHPVRGCVLFILKTAKLMLKLQTQYNTTK